MGGRSGQIGATATSSVRSTERGFARVKAVPPQKKQKRPAVIQHAYVGRIKYNFLIKGNVNFKIVIDIKTMLCCF